jgi:hypothetical protein
MLYATLPYHQLRLSSQEQANFSDSSGPSSICTEGEDEKMTKRWQKDVDGILIFVRPYIDSTLEPSD